ncbi:hypothetical protein QUA56_03345 [Microcoleus sp. N3A4]|uniref:hypothetical protein n=1 Tax=Microcoleus sp. N3A4 TaxID=3055379 RepID=UPI002FD057A5
MSIQIFVDRLFFHRVSVLAVGVVEVLPTAANTHVEGAIADISINKGKIKILQFIFVSPNLIVEWKTI